MATPVEFSLKDEIIKCPSSDGLTKGQTAGQTNAAATWIVSLKDEQTQHSAQFPVYNISL